ncbi:hypothetical protein EDC01DRAFT_649849 [Geopyxis carbonaria]|nr:hypothetical protein EDC01DRAFT_649849 [Geopyxis carbonaria]
MGSVKEAAVFLTPIFDREQLTIVKEKSLILRLSKNLTPSTEEKVARPILLRYTLDLVIRLHHELAERDAEANGMPLESPGERRTIFALLDLLILEGIYPALSPGVDIPIERRARSFIVPSRNKPVSDRIQEVAEDDVVKNIFKSIVEGLLNVLHKGEYSLEEQSIYKKEPWRRYKGLESMVRERCLVDLIAGCGQLAFDPEAEIDNREHWKAKFTELTDGISTGTLMPILMSLLHPGAPPWFRQPVTKCLSLLPISRPQGVQNILELFLSMASSGNVAQEASAQLSTDALAKVSRLLSSVPSSTTPEAYFRKVCPQLLELLQSSDLGLQRSSAYVIAELLGKKGSFIQTEIVDKIISKFNPQVSAPARNADKLRKNTKVSSALLDLEDTIEKTSNSSLIFEIPNKSETKSLITEEEPVPLPKDIIIPESKLLTALSSLELLLSSHPTPLIPERLISPILVPLWGLCRYAKYIGRNAWYERVSGILKSFFAVSLDQSILERIQDNLAFVGTDNWVYAPGSSGGIEIRSTVGGGKTAFDMDVINSGVEEFLAILETEKAKGSILSDYFLSIFRTWLSRDAELEPMKMLINAKVLQEMLASHGEALTKKPTEILQVIKSVLDEYVNYLEELKNPSKKASLGKIKPSLGALGQIVPDAPESFIADDDEGSEETQRSETAAMALSLLNILISSPETKLSETDKRLVTTLHPSLTYLSSSAYIDPNLTMLATNLTAVLPIHTHTVSTTSTPTPLVERQREEYTTAISYLRDPLIPVRAHGLYLLRQLILDRAPIVDVTNTARLLIGMVKDGDSFVYLNVIKCLSALTDRHSKTVTKLLVGAYMDDEDVLHVKGNSDDNLTLDERLKIGEALLATVQRLGGALVGEAAQTVGLGMINIVSRRRTRQSSELDKQGPLTSDATPGSDDDDDDDDDDEEEFDEDGNILTDKQKQTRNTHARIVAGWGNTPHAEDLRIRTSALSILGSAIEVNPGGLGTHILRDALDVSLSILTLESTLEAAILRRAAVVCIGGILKSVVKTDEGEDTWRMDVWRGVIQQRIPDIRRVVGYVRATDEDGLVREQASVVVENMDAVVQRRVLGGAMRIESPAEGLGMGLNLNI